MNNEKLQSATIIGNVNSATVQGTPNTNGILGGVAISGYTKVINNNYEKLLNKPSIEGVELIGNRELSAFGLIELSQQDIDDVLFGGE